MPEYRAYWIGDDGVIVGRVDLVCADESEARFEAEKLTVDYDVELWELDRRIEVYKVPEARDVENRMSQPAGYRAYVFGAKGHVEKRALLNGADDAAAKEQLRQLAGKSDAELWYGSRLVCVYRDQTTLSPGSRPSPVEEV